MTISDPMTKAAQPIPVDSRFGRLVVAEGGLRVRGEVAYRCACDCGGSTIVTGASLRRQQNGTRSCGCLHIETIASVRRSHGQTGTPTYVSWRGATERCFNPNNAKWPRYGGRGITVCERWRGPDGFANFLSDMGEKPRGTTLDRRDNNGNYEPGNCRWATAIEQGHNTSTVRLTEADVAKIKRRIINGDSSRDIARDYHVVGGCIGHIKAGRAWVDVPAAPP